MKRTPYTMRLNKGWQVNDGADILRMHADYLNDCTFHNPTELDMDSGETQQQERQQFNDFVSYVRSTRPTPFPPPRIAALVSSDRYIYEFGFAPINAEIVNFLCEFFIGMLRRWGNLHVLSVYSGVALIERQIHDRVREENKGDAATTFRLEWGIRWPEQLIGQIKGALQQILKLGTK